MNGVMKYHNYQISSRVLQKNVLYCGPHLQILHSLTPYSTHGFSAYNSCKFFTTAPIETTKQEQVLVPMETKSLVFPGEQSETHF